MCIEWKENKSFIGKSGDLLLTGRSERRFAQRGESGYITSTLITDYCAGGHIIYENNALKRILNPEGYVTKQSNGTSNYYYYAKDHLGNNRAVFGATPTTFGGPQQEINYYPFGMPFYAMGILGGFSTGTQPYKFGDKEYDEMHGLNWYDFGARYYSGIIPVFMTIDPLCEKFYSISPYVYCFNNPLRYIDRDGRAPGDVFKTKDAAARDWGNYYNGASIINKREYASSIYETKSGYSYSVANEGGTDGAKPSAPPGSAKWVGTVHSHGDYQEAYVDPVSGFDGNNNFSTDDTDSADRGSRHFGAENSESYLATPSGTMLKYTPPGGTSQLDSNMPSDPNDPNRVNTINPKIDPNMRYNPSEDKEPKSKF